MSSSANSNKKSGGKKRNFVREMSITQMSRQINSALKRLEAKDPLVAYGRARWCTRKES